MSRPGHFATTLLRSCARDGQDHDRRLWNYVRDDRLAWLSTSPAVWFTHSEDRKGEHPRRHLKDFANALQADAYSGLRHAAKSAFADFDAVPISAEAGWSRALRAVTGSLVGQLRRVSIQIEALSQDFEMIALIFNFIDLATCMSERTVHDEHKLSIEAAEKHAMP